MYSLEYTFQNGSACRFMDINVTVHKKEPICTTIYSPTNNNIQLSCEWNPFDLEDGAQMMIRNRLFTGNIITTTSDKNLTPMISTAVSMEDVLSENVPDLCLVSRNEMNATCSFLIYMKSKEKKTKESDFLISECCSSLGNEPNIDFYDINGNLWPSSSRGTFVIHKKPPSTCDKESPSILICANETYDGLIVYGLAKLFLPMHSQIMTRISEHKMKEGVHCENMFSIEIRRYPPVFIDMTTPSTVSKRNASDKREMHHIRCQEEHSIAPTLTTESLTSKSRTVYTNECLEQRNITREVHTGGCLSLSVPSYQSLTERKQIVIRKIAGSGILISCYLFHGIPKCLNFLNQRLGAIVYDNGTIIKVSLSHAKLEDSGEYVFEIRENNTILCKIARVNISVFDMLEREPTCSTRIKKYTRNLQFNCEWLQNDTYTRKARLMIENQTIYHYRTRWTRHERSKCFTTNKQIIAAVTFEFLFFGIAVSILLWGVV